jgi:hypothetical protein
MAKESPSLIFNHVFIYLPDRVRANPEWLLPSKMKKCGSFGTWYKHMGTLFSYQIFTDGSLDEYDYFLRFDSDYYLIEKLPIDLFEELHVKKKDFAYTRRKDMPVCTEGFYEHSEKYMTANNLKPLNYSFYSEIAVNHVTYFGNFAVGRVSFFTGCDYVKWAHHMMDAGGVYYARWDEQHHLPLGLSLFNTPDQVLFYNLTENLAHKCQSFKLKEQCSLNSLSCTWNERSNRCGYVDSLARGNGGYRQGKRTICVGDMNSGLY